MKSVPSIVHRAAVATLTMAAALVLGACAAPPEDAGDAAENEERPAPYIHVTRAGAFPLEAHLEAEELQEMKFGRIFGAGAALFHTEYESADGVGIARLADGSPSHRFNNVPLPGTRTGNNSQACGSCHVDSADGPATMNVVDDPDRDGLPPFTVRNTISLFGDGLLQALSWEITEELQAIRDDAAATAQASPGEVVERELSAKGVGYGVIRATAAADGEVSVDVSGVEGVDPDLVVRPFGGKGNNANLRNIVAGAAAGLLGMFGEELEMLRELEPDADGDGVEREFSVGDITAITLYNAGQEIPVELDYLVAEGHAAEPTPEDAAAIGNGRALFMEIGCASCHVPALELDNTVFEEPTLRGNGHYYNENLAALGVGYDPDSPISFDMTEAGDRPRVVRNENGGATVRLYGDLRRHAMGRQLATAGPTPALTGNGVPLQYEDEPVRIPADVFLTPELWGVGDTGPWLHDGRAGSLAEAVLLHGEDEPAALGEPGRSEAQEVRDAFVALSSEEQIAVVAFLRSLRTHLRPR
jgi:cytochrome c peroxidase